MRKSMLYLLILTLIFQLMCPVYAGAAASEVSDNDVVTVSKEQQLLDAIGVRVSPEDEYINRGEFAALVASLIGNNGKVTVEKSSFSDISDYYLYKNEVETVKNYGLMTGYADKFEPIKKITLEEAVKVIVSLGGYEMVANAKGGYPAGYLQVANSLKLLKGVEKSSEGYLTADAIYMLIFNFLDTPVYEISAVINPDTLRFEQSADTYGKKYFGIKEIEGRIVANSASALLGYSKSPANKITVDDETYYYNVSGITECLGQQITGFAREISGLNDVYEIIYFDISEESHIEKINKDDIMSVIGFNENDPIKYKRNPEIVYSNDKGNSKTAKIGGDLQIAYNGIITTDITNEDFTADYGYIELVDTDGDKYFDFIGITNFVSYVVDRIDIPNKRLVFKYNQGNFTLGDQKVVSVTHDGRIIDYASILPDTAVTVRTSKLTPGMTLSDSEVIYVDISSSKIRGSIANVNKEDNIITVEGKKYEYSETLESELIIGAQFDFYIDIFGIICGAEIVVSDQGEYYFMTAFKYDDGMFDKLSMQFVDMSGDVVAFDVPEKLIYTGPDLDGGWIIRRKVDKKLIAQFFTTHFNSRCLFKLVVEEGELKEIIAPVNGADTVGYAGYSDDFSLDRKIVGSDLSPHDYCLDNVYRYNAGGSIVILDNELGDAEDVKITKSTQKLNFSGLQNIEVYDADYEMYAEVIVAHVREAAGSDSQEWTSWETSLFVVDKITQKLSDDGDAVNVLHGYVSGNYESYVCADDNVIDNFSNNPFAIYGGKKRVTELSRGDLVMLRMNNDNEVTNFMSVLTFDGTDIPTDYRFATGNGGDWGAILATYYDRVEYCFDRTFSLRNDPAKIIPMTGYIYLCDLANDEVKKLSYSEVYGLLNDASSPQPDFAMVRQRRSQHIETIIYRR